MNRPLDLRDLAALLVTQALVGLGELPEPASNQQRVDLDAARLAIDLLDVLEQRTRAAGSDEEERILLGSLAELRLAYVRVRDAASSSPQPSEGMRG
jgi:hypothetical protein